MIAQIHRKAGKIALRALGEDTPANRRIVYRWAAEGSEAKRPFPIYKDGQSIYAREADIARGSKTEGE